MGAIDLTKFRPNLAAETSDYDWDKLVYPVYVSPKIDGIRCVTHPALGPVSRSLKPIPNRYIRQYLAWPQSKWLDGEIVIGEANAPDVFNKSQSGVMTQDGEPDFTYWVFDNFEAGHRCGFGIRYADAERVILNAPEQTRVKLLPHNMVESYDELLFNEELYISQGYEGLMIRSPGGLYKFGRSTLREQGLLKMKRFLDAEAIIVGWEPLLRNNNEAVIDALGLQKRGYSQDGKVADDSRVGKFIVRGDPMGKWADVTFSVGSGLDDSSRLRYRQEIDSLMGKVISYKYQPHGSKDAPRTPIFKGLRHD